MRKKIMIKLMLATILSIGLLFSQSEQRFASEQIFDIAGQMKVWSKALMTGEMQGIVLSESQLVDTQKNIDQAKAEIILLVGGEIQIVETIAEVVVKAVFDPIVLEGIQYFLDHPDTRFYKGNRPNSINRMQKMKDAIQQ